MTWMFILLWVCVCREVEPPKSMEEFKEAELHYQQVNEKYLKSIEMSGTAKVSTGVYLRAGGDVHCTCS